MDAKAQQELTDHIQTHVVYPVTKKDFVAACANMAHIPSDTKDWVTKALPDRTFSSAEDIFHALNLPHTHSH